MPPTKAELLTKLDGLTKSQPQLKAFAKELDVPVLEGLCAEIEQVDWPKMAQLWKKLGEDAKKEAAECKIEPWGEVYSIHKQPKAERDKYTLAGMNLIADQGLAVTILAGGQGTRLGVPYPKGLYDMGNDSPIYKILMSKVSAVINATNTVTGKSARLPVYIMTSPATLEVTRSFFEKNAFFGLPAKDVNFFAQEFYPCLDDNGKPMLKTKGSLCLNPNGNGGVYTSMARAGVLDDMGKRGVKLCQIFGVDNVLARLGDPAWAGYVATHGFEVSNKVCRKRGPHEKVGVMCLRDGKPGVVEYSEISKEMAEMTDAGGELVYGAGNVAMHLFSVPFLKEMGEGKKLLPIHRARKKIPHINAEGKEVKPDTPNGNKLEFFIFDSFRYAKKVNAYECLREEEFSPVKNAVGKDSPASAKEMLLAWKRQAHLSPDLIFGNTCGNVAQEA